MSEARILKDNPLSDTETILRDEYYGAPAARQSPPPGAARHHTAARSSDQPAKDKKAKPTHYKVVCISLYTQDIENLEAKVAELKRRGHTKANKSQLIRMALRQLDLDALPIPQQ
jgi:hypothetical protein